MFEIDYVKLILENNIDDVRASLRGAASSADDFDIDEVTKKDDTDVSTDAKTKIDELKRTLKRNFDVIKIYEKDPIKNKSKIEGLKKQQDEIRDQIKTIEKDPHSIEFKPAHGEMKDSDAKIDWRSLPDSSTLHKYTTAELAHQAKIFQSWEKLFKKVVSDKAIIDAKYWPPSHFIDLRNAEVYAERRISDDGRISYTKKQDGKAISIEELNSKIEKDPTKNNGIIIEKNETQEIETFKMIGMYKKLLINLLNPHVSENSDKSEIEKMEKFKAKSKEFFLEIIPGNTKKYYLEERIPSLSADEKTSADRVYMNLLVILTNLFTQVYSPFRKNFDESKFMTHVKNMDKQQAEEARKIASTDVRLKAKLLRDLIHDKVNFVVNSRADSLRDAGVDPDEIGRFTIENRKELYAEFDEMVERYFGTLNDIKDLESGKGEMNQKLSIEEKRLKLEALNEDLKYIRNYFTDIVKTTLNTRTKNGKRNEKNDAKINQILSDIIEIPVDNYKTLDELDQEKVQKKKNAEAKKLEKMEFLKKEMTSQGWKGDLNSYMKYKQELKDILRSKELTASDLGKLGRTGKAESVVRDVADHNKKIIDGMADSPVVKKYNATSKYKKDAAKKYAELVKFKSKPDDKEVKSAILELKARRNNKDTFEVFLDSLITEYKDKYEKFKKEEQDILDGDEPGLREYVYARQQYLRAQRKLIEISDKSNTVDLDRLAQEDGVDKVEKIQDDSTAAEKISPEQEAINKELDAKTSAAVKEYLKDKKSEDVNVSDILRKRVIPNPESYNRVPVKKTEDKKEESPKVDAPKDDIAIEDDKSPVEDIKKDVAIEDKKEPTITVRPDRTSGRRGGLNKADFSIGQMEKDESKDEDNVNAKIKKALGKASKF